ncbi:MAG: hypothetical protein ABSD56_00545 [Bryobacteraceae bacterium]
MLGRLPLMLLLLCQATFPAETQAPPAGAPRPEAQRAFETYVRLTESRLDGLLQLQDAFKSLIQ